MNDLLLSYWRSLCAAVLYRAPYLSSILLISALLYLSMNAAPGCMDNSYHADPCAAYDYKNYHYVDCDCRCERYARLYKRGTCGGCHHYHVPRDPEIVVRTNVRSAKKNP